MLSKSRALHYVLKIGSLKKSIEFFRDRLNMTVLRHEVFEEGCAASCNGPYANKWTKTMIGYGPEDNFFVLELTYNYTVSSYTLGNDLQHIKISLKDRALFEKIDKGDKHSDQADSITLFSPDGYKLIVELDESAKQNDITEVSLASSDLNRSIAYWRDLLQMKELSRNVISKEVIFSYAHGQSNLRLRQLSEPVEHKSAFGRMAYSCPSADLKPMQAAVEAAHQKVLVPYTRLDTPGKATVEVVIVADPDGHEICFVGDEAFRQLSKVDPNANDLVNKSIADDKSDEWYEKKGLSKSGM